MIRIVVYSESNIEDVSAREVQDVLWRELGVWNSGVRVSNISQKQFDKGMKRHRG